MLPSALLLLGLLLPALALAALPSDFFLDIDGISVDLSQRFFCALEQVAGHDVGGAVRCFGDEKIAPPKDEVFVQVSTSARGACGITLDQRVRCWGDPVHMHPQQMDGLFTQISGGENVICGLRINGAITCFYGKWKSFKIQDTQESNFVQLSCGLNYCCALNNEGHVRCGGDVAFGHSLQRGDLHQNPHVVMQVGADGELSVAPNEVIPTNKDSEQYEDFLLDPQYQQHPMKFKQIAVAHGYMCGIQYIDGDIFCWGNDDVELPVTIMKGPFRTVSANERQVCGIMAESNELKCAYDNALTVMEDQKWDQVKVGSHGHICAVSMNSELVCVHASADPEVLQEVFVA